MMRKFVPVLLAFIAIASFANAGVNVSAPVNGASVQSPVHFAATASWYRSISSMALYVDSQSKYTTKSSSLVTDLPLPSGTHSIIIKAWSSGKTLSSSFTIHVVSNNLPPAPTPLQITTSSLAAGTVGTAYSAVLQTTGGTTPYTWSVASGSLPAGLTLSASGAISGTPTVAGSFAFTPQVKDSASSPQTATISGQSITIVAPGPTPIAITTSSLPGATVGSAYTANLSASGGTPPYVWSFASGQLPAGLTLSTSGAITGTPASSGSSSFSVQAKDSASSPQTATKPETLTVAAGTSITPIAMSCSVPSATVGIAYQAALSATGGTPPYLWSVTSGQLPAGLSLSGASISGMPTTAGTSSFTLQVKDSASSPQAASQNESIPVTVASAGNCTGTCYYVSPSGNDSNAGTSSSAPWKTIAQVQSFQSSLQPGESVLFERGGVWYEQLDITKMNGSSSAPITIGNYGTGNLPVIDGGYTSSTNGRNYCIDAINTSYSYLVVDGIECRNAYVQGITFKFYSGSGGNHITVTNSYIHNTGRGACQTCTVTPSDPGGYVNQLDAQFVNYVTFSNNVLNHCGGHNCLQVHYDEGGSLVSGNKIGTTLAGANASDNFCVHNCLDVKGGVNNQILNNYVYCPNCKAGAAYYTENTGDRGDSTAYSTWIGNVANQHGNGFEAEAGVVAGPCNTSPCAINAKYYNNTTYLTGSPFASGSCVSGTGIYMHIDFQKNIWDGGSFYWPGGTCNVTWDYNDDGGVNSVSGNLTGAHDLKQVNPQYSNVSSGNFAPQNTTIMSYGANDAVTSYSYLGGVQ
jgi:hypothetical protein